MSRLISNAKIQNNSGHLPYDNIDSIMRYIFMGQFIYSSFFILSIKKETYYNLGLKSVFLKHIPSYGNEKVPVICVLMLLIWNITLGRQPLYEFSGWVKDIDPKCHGLDADFIDGFNDDRFAIALDKLYLTDYTTLMTEIVLKMIKRVNLDLPQKRFFSPTNIRPGLKRGLTSSKWSMRWHSFYLRILKGLKG